MCHGAEWEMYILAREREIARRNREKAEAEGRKSPTPPRSQPSELPAKGEVPEPV